MRVPTPIVIIICLLVATITWLIGTHRLDFTKAPTPEELVEISENWEEGRPHATHKQNGARPAPHHPLESDTGKPDHTEATPSPPLPVPDFALQPSLGEFGTLSNQDAALLARLANHLESSSHTQHALLAWERIIDTSNPTMQQRLDTAKAIKRLKTVLPPWNSDPANEISIILHAGANLQETDDLEKALENSAELISQASGNILHVRKKTSFGKIRNPKTTVTPVAIWFSRPGESDQEPMVETIPISFMVNSMEPELFAEQTAAGVYSLLRSHLNEKTGFTPLPEISQLPEDTTPNELLTQHITRLMWREFANSISE